MSKVGRGHLSLAGRGESNYLGDGNGARHGMPSELDASVRQWGSRQTTAVSLKDLCEIGLDEKRRLRHARFLHEELCIRLAQRVMELESLPYGLPERPGIRAVISWYTEFLETVEDSAVPINQYDDEDFTSMLEGMLHVHPFETKAMASAVQELMAEMGPDYEHVHAEVDAILKRFFMARIGVRFLMQHHVESLHNRDGHSGILELDCQPAIVAQKAAQDSSAVCRKSLGKAPHIEISEPSPGTFTYVPSHLYYMLCETLKNACRATVEHHGDLPEERLPPVTCSIAFGHEDVTLKISDRGGGIPRAQMPSIWTFMYSTWRRCNFGEEVPSLLLRGRTELAGWGVGLPLSLLYARYFGGDLRLLSMSGFGSDVYLHLSRLGSHVENLPEVVLRSPSMRDSSLGGDDELHERLLVSLEEEAFLRKELTSLRRTAGS